MPDSLSLAIEVNAMSHWRFCNVLSNCTAHSNRIEAC